jgi:hypothetical protein
MSDRASDWARPVVHWEIQARDVAKMRGFYARLFNWEVSDGPVPMISAGIGGPEPDGLTGHILPSDTARTVLYVQVRELRASMEHAVELGGTIVAEPFDVPNGPTVARIADPEGNHIALVQQ